MSQHPGQLLFRLEKKKNAAELAVKNSFTNVCNIDIEKFLRIFEILPLNSYTNICNIDVKVFNECL